MNSHGFPNVLDSILGERPSVPIKKNGDKKEQISSSILVDQKELPFTKQNTEPISKIYDEIPDDTAIELQSDKDGFNNLLNPSELLIKQILNYVQENNVETINIKESTEFKGTSAFIYEDKKYILKENDARIIYAMILQMDEESTLAKVASKRPNILHNLLENITKENRNFKNPFILEIDYELMVRLIQKALSMIINNQLEKSPHSREVKANTNTFSVNIGRTIFESIMINKYRYAKLTEEEKKKFKVKKDDKDEINGYRRRTLQEIQEFLESFENLDVMKGIISENKKPYSKPMVDKIKATINYLRKTLLTAALYADNINKDSPDIIKSKDDLYQIEKELIIVYTEIGLEIVNWLVHLNILEEIRSSRINVPALRICRKYETFAYAPASSFKPPISTIEMDTEYTFRKGYIDYTIDIKKELIPNKKETQIKSSPELNEIIKGAGSMPFCLDVNAFKDYLTLARKMLDIKPNDARRIEYISAVYCIDFQQYINQFLKENPNLSSINGTILENLLVYAQKLDVVEYPENNPEIKEHLAIDAAYKKIRSYKYYLKGLLNDLNLYKHFEYFYIPKYAVSTGRLQSSPFYLQLQGNKSALPFIHCYLEDGQDLTQEEYEIMKQIFMTTNPEINEKDLPPDLESLNLQARNLYTQQIQELCIPNVDIHEYKQNKQDIITEFAWLYKSCKKLEYVFYLKSLLDALNDETYKCKIIKKDATGSGPQIISMLTEDDDLMKFTNIAGDQYNDLYQRMLNEYLSNIEKQKEMLEEFSQNVFKVSFKDLKEGTNIPHGKKNIIHKLLWMSKSQSKKKGKNYSEFYTSYKENKASLENKRSTIENMIFKVTSPSIDIAEEIENSGKSSDKMLSTLYKLRVFRENVESFEKIPPEMLTRKLFKQRIMALAYSQGRKSRGESIKEDFIDFFISKGYKNPPISEQALNIVITNLLDFFYHYSNKYFGSLMNFLDAIQFFVIDSKIEQTQKFRVDLKYCSWILRCSEHTESRHSFNLNNVPYKFTLYHNHFHNTKEIGSIVPSIFVQSIEAHIVHELYSRVIKMNEELKKNKLPGIIVSTNHDNYGVNAIYGPMLTPLVQECYNTVILLEIPILDKHLKRTHKKIKCINPNFIRF